MPSARHLLSLLATCAALLIGATSASAQHDQHASAPGWGWAIDTSVFFGGNFQDRKFRDFHQFESQNWLMGSARRKAAAGTLFLHSMFSFERFTLGADGSSQVFQTGETLGGGPVLDYQHPHDLIMALSGAFERPLGPATLIVKGGLVDSPALGPTPFMHRPSAELYPTAPLSHHQLDSTHITHGVVTAGVRRGVWQLEGSAFHGREPDEDRLDLDLGPLDSYAMRGTWIRGGTRAQVSIGWLEEPHVLEPGDVTRVTASLEHVGGMLGRPGALTFAWGQNRGQAGNEQAWLLETILNVWDRGTAYARGEVVDKHIIGAGGLHPPGLQHPHIISTVSALTVGYQHQLWRWASPAAANVFTIGADATGYLVPNELKGTGLNQADYGQPVSFHVYGRWTLRFGNAPSVPVPHHEQP
jgi:hypothetical protein